MKIALMQPYFLPYLGYFQLINAVDKFIFYDDIGFIKQGWIHRNNIVLNGKRHRFTIPIKNSSSFKPIYATFVSSKPDDWQHKLSLSLRHAYGKAPYFESVFPKIDKILRGAANRPIADVAMDSIQTVLDYLSIEKTLLRSSERDYHTIHNTLSENIVSICQKEGATTYMNAIGGQHFIERKYFEQCDIQIHFLKPFLRNYTQKAPEFVAGLSILDVLMYNNPLEIKAMLGDYTIL